jgi:uncharacterized protein (DUF1015 family)
MLDIQPFNGYRYHCDKPEELGRFIAPPYDMIDEKKVDALYARDPLNAVRIAQNRREQGDVSNRDRHVRAARFFNDCVERGIIARDPDPSFYVYEQEFALEVAGARTTCSRTGVVGMVALTDFSEKVVFPHEYTLTGPKADRYEQMEETRLNEGQIFGLLSDESGDRYRMIAALKSGKPDGSAIESDNVQHRLYRCSDKTRNKAFAEAVKGSTVLIADGHHRDETALSFFRNYGNDPALGRVMMTLVSMADPGLVIRSFHRLIRRRKQDRKVDMLRELGKYFSISECGAATIDGVNQFLGAPDSGGEMLFCDSATKRLFRCALNASGGEFLAAFLPERSMLWKQLDMSKINAIVINGILGLPLDGGILHDVVDYMNDARAALERCLDPESYYGCFFIHPVRISAIHEIVAKGERMPQKSTNFYPKLYSGLVFNKLGGA